MARRAKPMEKMRPIQSENHLSKEPLLGAMYPPKAAKAKMTDMTAKTATKKTRRYVGSDILMTCVC